MREVKKLLIFHRDSFLFPSCVVVASAVLLLLQILISQLTCYEDASEASAAGHVSKLGGPIIFGYYLVRVAACFSLSGIAIVQLLKANDEKWAHISLLSIFVCGFINLLVDSSLF